jgi:hypothetical protein
LWLFRLFYKKNIRIYFPLSIKIELPWKPNGKKERKEYRSFERDAALLLVDAISWFGDPNP